MSFLTRWDPWRELERMTRVLDEFPKGGSEMTLADWAPRVDIKETPEEFLVFAELPGVRKEDVKVTVKDGVLNLKGERRMEKEEKNTKYHRVERHFGSFMRSFSLPEGIEEAKVMADYKEGVLNVHLPKSKEQKSKMVDIKIN